MDDRMTAAELLDLPRDAHRYELVNGELHVREPKGHLHGSVASEIARDLGNYVKAQCLGCVYAAETGFVLASNPDTVRAPDVAFVNRARVESVGNVPGFFPGAPDLAIEVVSPGDTSSEVEEKALAWLDAGTRIVLTVDPTLRAVMRYKGRDDIQIIDENRSYQCPIIIIVIVVKYSCWGRIPSACSPLS